MTGQTIDIAIRHRLRDFTLDVALTLPATGVTALFGPSGAGKSTVIAALAGLLRPDEALIRVGGQVLADTASGLLAPPHRRRAGLVFQDARLFPHMSVAGNLRYGLRRAGREDAALRFDDVVELLGIGHLLAARPRTLSGGERQRVAIGRALLSQPRMLLMDEPLASLDGPRKAEILPFLSRLRASLSLPVVYVTHALEEVAQLADTLVMLDRGRVIAVGPVAELTARADLPLAGRDDAGAVLDGGVDGHELRRGLTRLRCGEAVLLVPLLAAEVGAPVRIRVPAREVILAAGAPAGISITNILPGRVARIRRDAEAHAALVEVEVAGTRLLSRVTLDAAGRLGLTEGAPVFALVKAMSVEVMG